MAPREKLFCWAICALTTSLATSSALASAEAARQFFAQYVALGHAYDASLADLYPEDALIKNKRSYPTGEVRELTTPLRATRR